MKKVFFLLAVVLGSMLLNAQTNQMVWNNGRVQYAQPITNVDSLTFPMGSVIDMDTMCLLLPRSMREIVYVDRVVLDTVYVHDTSYVYVTYCADDNVLAGVFTVSAEGKKVRFTKGNLQCSGVQSGTYSWSFAENQYDMLGDANISGFALADKIDIFGWSGDNTTAQWGINISQDNSDYQGDFVDWGQNSISSAAPNTYRTLTEDEWYYLINTRTNASSLWGVARINLSDDGTSYVNGVILLPDSWTCPAGITFMRGSINEVSIQAYADYQIFTLVQWEQLEEAGAVFLPATGRREGTEIKYMQQDGNYQSGTMISSTNNLYMLFTAEYLTTSNSDRNKGRAVRLVKDM